SSSADTAPCEIYTLSLHDALPILNILHHEKLQLLCRLGKGFIIGPAVSRICAQNPQSLDLSGVDALDDLVVGDGRFLCQHLLRQDRKSTRLNSSHVSISYAVFCLK